MTSISPLVSMQNMLYWEHRATLLLEPVVSGTTLSYLRSNRVASQTRPKVMHRHPLLNTCHQEQRGACTCVCEA
jgi:hypothetical protein